MKRNNLFVFFTISIYIIMILNKTTFANEISNNTNLKVMRLGKEGITPEFQKDITEYYLVVDNSVNNIDITAIPENETSTVKVSGNQNLKQGLNIITITVANEQNKSIYTIYVTKTSNKESANANLINLAVREGLIFPSFEANVNEYKIDIDNDVEKLDILAIPENENAKIEINGNTNLKNGNNRIEIEVTAANGITTKRYILNAYKRNIEEQIIAAEEKYNEIEKLEKIFSEETDMQENEKNIDNKTYLYLIISIIFILGIGFFMYIKNRNKK